MARAALTSVTLFPPCKVFCTCRVRSLLTGGGSSPYDFGRGGDRTAPAAPDRDDGGGQLDPRPGGGAPSDRDPRRGGPARGCLLRLSPRRAVGRARPPSDVRDERRRDDPAATASPGRGHHRQRGPRALAGDDPG